MEEHLDRQKTWVNPKDKKLYSRELYYKPYYYLCKRYNNKFASYDYYVIMLDNKQDGKDIKKTYVDSYGRIKIDLFTIWNKTSLVYIEDKTNINIEVKEIQPDGVVYLLDI